MDGYENNEYFIRVPVDMIQLTERDGKVWPVAFDWRKENGDVQRVEIEKVLPCIPCAEQKSGTVGDRYECTIDGQTEYLYYSILAPRKWFKVIPVTRDVYMNYYKLDDKSE